MTRSIAPSIGAPITATLCTAFAALLSVTAVAVDDSIHSKGLDLYRDDSAAPKTPDMFDRDYYSHDPTIRGLLRTVEAYHMQKGLDRISEGKLELAFQEFDFILRYYPNHPRALEIMTDLCVSLNRKQAGEGYFNHALELFPNNPRAAKAITYRHYGRLLYRFGDNDRALEMLKKSAALDDIASQTHYFLGLAYFTAKDYPNANLQAQKAYARKYPMSELREKLVAANAWNPSVDIKSAGTAGVGAK